MNLKRYDEALLNKLKSVFNNTISCNTEKAISESRNEENQVYLPLISFWRISNNYDPNSTYNSDPHTKRGMVSKIDVIANSVSMYKSFVVDINYQIDIWSDKREEVDLIYRELIMFLLEEPDLSVSIGDGVEEFALQILESDTTPDMSEFTDKGKLYRNSITVHIPYARLIFSAEDRPIKSIEVRVYDLESNIEL